MQWTDQVENGDASSPSVTDSGVYVSYACGQAYDFAPQSGASIWHHTSGCEGGGGSTSPVAAGRLWMCENYDTGPLILDPASGAEIGTFSSTAIPAFDGDTAFFLNGANLEATDASSGATPLWSFSGDGKLDSNPIVDNGVGT